MKSGSDKSDSFSSNPLISSEGRSLSLGDISSENGDGAYNSPIKKNKTN